MTPQSAPVLSSAVVFNRSARKAEVLAKDLGLHFAISGRHAKKLLNALGSLNGVATIAQAARKHGIPCSDLLLTVKGLGKAGLCVDAAMLDVAHRPPSTVIAEHCTFTAQNVFSQPFWTRLSSGRQAAKVVLGFGIEFFHFVDAANQYMPLGVASVDGNAEIRQILAKHYCEEADHGAIFLDGLAACGLPRQAIVDAPPLPTTAALINHLREVASEGYLRYSLMFAVMQPAGNESAKQDSLSYFNLLGKRYPAANRMFQAFAKHAAIDQELGHSNPAFYKLLRAIGPLRKRELERLIHLIHDLGESFVFFFEGIEEHYSKPDATLPRRAITAAAL